MKRLTCLCLLWLVGCSSSATPPVSMASSPVDSPSMSMTATSVALKETTQEVVVQKGSIIDDVRVCYTPDVFTRGVEKFVPPTAWNCSGNPKLKQGRKDGRQLDYFICEDGKNAIEEGYAEATPFNKGVAIVGFDWSRSQGEHPSRPMQGCIDTKGNLLQQTYGGFEWNTLEPLIDGRRRYVSNGKMGFMDESCQVAIAAQWAWVDKFECGFAVVCNDCFFGETVHHARQPDCEHPDVYGGSFGAIDVTGKFVIPMQRFASMNDVEVKLSQMGLRPGGLCTR